MFRDAFAESIDWPLVVMVSVYALYGTVLVPLVTWGVLRNYQRRRLALRDYEAAGSGARHDRGLRVRDLLDAPGVGLLVLPVAVFVGPYLTWTLVALPGALAPLFAGWWWLRLRSKGVRAAHIYAWLMLVLPGAAWSLAMLAHVDGYRWQESGYQGMRVPWFTAEDLIGGRLGISLGVAAYFSLSAVAAAAARKTGRLRIANMAAIATVPLAAQMMMSVPAGPVYLTWMVLMVGFWIALRHAEVDPRGERPPIQALLASLRPNAVVDVEATSGRRETLAYFVAATALSATGLLAVRNLPAEHLAAPIASWSVVGIVGYGAHLVARRTLSRRSAIDLAIGSQVAATVLTTLLAGGFWALAGEEITRDSTDRFQIVRLAIGSGVLAVGVVSGWLMGLLRHDLRRFGALLLGWSWPIALMFALNIHGFDPTPRTLTDDWALSQVVSVVIGMTLWVGVMWRWYGVDEGQAESAVGEAGRVAAEPQVAPVEGRSGA